MFNKLGWSTEYGVVGAHWIDEDQVARICSKHAYQFSSAK
jgi:hypothetical protein